MYWKKLGYSLDLSVQKNYWQKSHAIMPVAIELEDRIRVYYTTRHNDGKSRITFYDVNKQNPLDIIYSHDKPIIDVGKIGTFDDCGTVATFVIKVHDKIYLYYNGYNVRNTVPWSNSIGLAISDDSGKTFDKLYNGPILDRYKDDCYFTITPWIINDNGKWHMWYTSGTGWFEVDNRKEPTYDIKYASSLNGIDWSRDFKVCIPQSNLEEAVARATITQDGDDLYMWFIYRGIRDFRDGIDSYRIGFAKGNINNPTCWTRCDSESGTSLGPDKFDDKMQAYPFVLKLGDGTTYMFYNGNNFGETGILVSKLTIESLKN